jgi:hypothetical protein
VKGRKATRRPILRSLAISTLGPILVVVGWSVALPSNLDQIDGSGDISGPGVDGYWLHILGVPLPMLALAALLAWRRSYREAQLVVAFGALSWVLTFTYRASMARTTGANMFLVPLIFLVVPTAIAMVLLVRWMCRR